MDLVNHLELDLMDHAPLNLPILDLLDLPAMDLKGQPEVGLLDIPAVIITRLGNHRYACPESRRLSHCESHLFWLSEIYPPWVCPLCVS